ncbi:MAG: peptidylprolyl isomerase [Acidobacteriota bacterium]
MTLRRWSLLLSVPALALAAGCGSHPAGPPVSFPQPPSSARPPASAASSLSGREAEAALLELEDRRAFDAGTLLAASGSGESATRARTAIALGRIGDDRAEPILRTLLADPDPDVRAAAAFGSGYLPETAAADLRPLLGDSDARVAAAAARAIGFAARPDGEEALIAALPGAATPEPRASLLRSLWRYANGASEAAALPFAGDSDPRVRAAALYALSRKPQPGSVRTLTAALADDADTAAGAARALGVLGLAESVEPLGAALEKRTPVVINALVALGTILEKAKQPGLSPDRRARVLDLAADANPNVAVPALTLLRHFAAGDREASRRLWSVALSGEGRRRQAALLSLTATLQGGASTALDAAAASEDPSLRAAAAEAAASLPAAEARPWRERFAADREVAVRLANLGSLKTAEEVRAYRGLVNSALTDADPGVRSAAVDALGLLEDPALLPLFTEAVEKSASDASPDVTVSVIGACEKLTKDAGAAALVDTIYRRGRTLPARLARRTLVRTFHRPSAELPLPEYVTGKTRADYAALAARARQSWNARVETAAGAFTIRLAGDAAPLTVVNFVSLAEKRYFDGVRIHRVVPNFVLQDGDPTGTGNGGPGYEIRDEISPLEYGRGAVGMALSGPDTGGSQWFATHSPQPHLNGLYTVFGQIVEGQSTLERIGQGERILRVSVSFSGAAR